MAGQEPLPYTLMSILAFNKGGPLVDLEKVATHYFQHVDTEVHAKLRNGETVLAVMEMEAGN